MLQMRDPAHPGEFLKAEVLAGRNLSVTKAAEILRIGRPALSAVLNCRAALSPELALRFEKAFGMPMELLLKMQLQFDIAEIRKIAGRVKVSGFKPAA
jgi:antitoxin HigA-1